MPCWFYDKKDLVNTPSAKDGISADTEAWYRKEGAKHIIDAGNKLGLRFDTCATGVVYFHRFYMFHSFKEFHRLVTAACCLFLAGKVEETPKKCKDIIKTFRAMLNDAQFAHFGDDPKEEVMTLERILLQTIKFDLMVEHPYAYLLKFAKLIKGDKAKIQKMVQMAWTFINDSLCTTLCLQWEPEIIAVAVMYLTSRLTKFDIVDWQGKPSGFRGKWYEFLVDDVTLELLEDICHQVLDLYSKAPQPQKEAESPSVPRVRHPPQLSDDDQSRSTPRTPKSPQTVKRTAPSAAGAVPTVQPMETDVAASVAPGQRESPTFVRTTGRNEHVPERPPGVVVQAGPQGAPAATSYSVVNPYMSTQMYSASFMSMEGSQSIQSLIGVQNRDDPQGRAAAASHSYPLSQPSSGSQYSTTPTYPAQSAAAAAAANYSSQRSQPASAGYRSSTPHQVVATYGQPYTGYQQQPSTAVAGYPVSYPPVPAVGTQQPPPNMPPQYGSSSQSQPTTPVSSTYQAYSGRTAMPAYSGSVNPNNQRTAFQPVPQQPNAGFQGQSAGPGGYQVNQTGYPGQPPNAFPGQNPGYQPAAGQHQIGGQPPPMRSNNRRDNWYS